MPSAPKLDAPQGYPLFDVQLRAISESLAGNGVVDNGDFEVTATATDLEISVADGTAFYIATQASLNTPPQTFTLSAGDASNDRWDTVYFDTSTGDAGVREGTPEQYPSPPDIQSDELLLAIIYVEQSATNVENQDILNWRAKFSNEAEEVHYDDNPGVYPGNSVEDALDELQEAAQISAYPLAIGDLANPYGLPVITDMDASGTDLTDSAGPGVIYDASAGVVLQSVLGGPASSLSAYPLAPATDLNVNAYPFALGDLASPFPLPSITDLDLDGNDLVDAGTIVWDTSAGWVPREQVDDEKLTATYTTTPNTTSGEEVALIDTATIGGASTLEIASADITEGNQILVVDATGTAVSNPITIDTEGSETIDGDGSVVIDNNYGSALFTSDGDNLFVAGGTEAGADPTSIVDGAETGNVPGGDQGVLVVDNLADGETVRIQKAVLTTATVEAIPVDVDLELVTFDNAGGFTSQAILIQGDGATVHDSVTGSPIASYENTTGSPQSIGVIVDNADNSAHEVVADVRGDIV